MGTGSGFCEGGGMRGTGCGGYLERLGACVCIGGVFSALERPGFFVLYVEERTA